MIKLINIVYHCHEEYNNPQQVLQKQAPAFGFANFLPPSLQIQFVKHLNYTGYENINGMRYAFFKSRNKFWYVPFATHRYIKQQKPGIVMIEGLRFPLQILFLQFSLGKHCKLIARHHGEQPYRGIKKLFQKIADKYIDAYLFTSHNNAIGWMGQVIKDPNKCIEVLEASTHFGRQDKIKSQAITGIKGDYNFLWVGRLIAGKDPFTVLTAFQQYASLQLEAKLYMIYQENALLADIKKIISQSEVLQQSVILVGKIKNEDLVYWYNAANFFISSSLAEAAGYAMLEAMACGCIPVATDIPSFNKITDNGKYGFLYPPMNAKALAASLVSLNTINIEQYRNCIENYFNENLCFKKIADDISDLCTKLYSVQG